MKIDFKPVHFKEAIDFFKSKIRIPTRHYTDLIQEEHVRGFMVAGAMCDDLLTDFQKALADAKEKSTPLSEFRKRFDQIVEKHGWGYNGSRGWRSKLIYNVNLRMANAAGRWAQIQRTKQRRPWLRYVATLDDRTRDDHRAWHGTVLPADDPFWKTHYPPNGWNCRCSVQQLSDRDLKRYGYKASAAPDARKENRQVRLGDGSYRNVPTPAGIDTGFGYNVGEAGFGKTLSDKAFRQWQAQGAKAWEVMTAGNWEDQDRPRIVPAVAPRAKLGPPVRNTEEMIAAVRKAIGGDERLFRLQDGSNLLINAETLGSHLDLNRGPFVPLLKELIETPFEIWTAFERHRGTGKVELRRRLVKVFDLKNGSVMLSAQVNKGFVEGWTFIPNRNVVGLNRSRIGKLTYALPTPDSDAAPGSD